MSCDGGGGAEGIEGFFACPIARDAAGAARVVADGRAPGVRVEGASDARGVVRAVAGSAAGRVLAGLFAPAVVEGAIDCRDVAFPGDGRVAAPGSAGVLRAVVGRLFSSPEVTDDRSGSASDAAAREATPALLGAEPGAGRVGGLFKLDPTLLRREAEAGAGFDALDVDGLDAAVGRRAVAGALPVAAVGRRGGADSLLAEGAWEAILRRTDDAGVEGAGSFLGVVGVLGTLELASLAGGCSMVRGVAQGPAQIIAAV
jgi:hypothetical protein